VIDTVPVILHEIVVVFVGIDRSSCSVRWVESILKPGNWDVGIRDTRSCRDFIFILLIVVMTLSVAFYTTFIFCLRIKILFFVSSNFG